MGVKAKVEQRLRSRTYWAALFLSALAIIEANANVVELLVPASWLPYWPLVFPLVMLAMREITTSAISDK